MPAYVTNDELGQYGSNATSLEQFSEAEKTVAATMATSEATYYLGVVASPSDVLKMHVARASVFHLFSIRGFAPQGDDGLLERMYLRAIQFYKDAAVSGAVSDAAVVTSAGSVEIYSEEKRGW